MNNNEGELLQQEGSVEEGHNARDGMGEGDGGVPTTEVAFFTMVNSHKKQHLTLRFPTAELTVDSVRSQYSDILPLADSPISSVGQFLNSVNFGNIKEKRSSRSRCAAAHLLILAWHHFPKERKKNITRGSIGVSNHAALVKNTLFVYAHFRRNSVMDVSLCKFDGVSTVVTRSEHLLRELVTKIPDPSVINSGQEGDLQGAGRRSHLCEPHPARFHQDHHHAVVRVQDKGGGRGEGRNRPSSRAVEG
jgi:hypothetical protein